MSGQPGNDDGHHAQVAALTEIVGALARELRRVKGKVDQLVEKPPTKDHTEPAAWVWHGPPDAEDDRRGAGDPQAAVETFVAWYNITFVGFDGGRARPIPPCWRRHPPLTMEIAALTYTWRAANLGAGANVRDAQYWLHQWRPGFSDRLIREWVHSDCFDGNHRAEGSPHRANRFDTAEQPSRSGHDSPMAGDNSGDVNLPRAIHATARLTQEGSSG